MSNLIKYIFRPLLFKPYARYWFEPFLKYMIDKNTGGKGFHYFLRDLCAVLAAWNFVPEDSFNNRRLASALINNLIKTSADKTKHIFTSNIRRYHKSFSIFRNSLQFN